MHIGVLMNEYGSDCVYFCIGSGEFVGFLGGLDDWYLEKVHSLFLCFYILVLC